MTSRRNFLGILFSQLSVLPVSAIIQACTYNKKEVQLPKLYALPVTGPVYEEEAFTLQWRSENIDTILLKIIAADGNLRYQTITTAHTQSFTVRDFIASGDYKIHLSDTANTGVYSESTFFTVQPSRKAVLTINPIHSSVYVHEGCTITWTSVNVAQIQFVLIHESGGIISNTTMDAGLQSYTLTIADPGSYRIQLISVADPTLISESQMFEVLVRQGNLAITSPNGGEVFSIQNQISIEWEATKINTVNVYYSYNNGGNWLNVASGLNALAGSYQWQLPDIGSDTYRIKIEDAQHPTVFDSSDNVFKVIASYDIHVDLYAELSVQGGYKVFESNALGNFTLVRISATSFKAYSHICTHNGCTIALQASKMYSCSCHGSEFDFEGNVTHGPATRPLDLLTATFNAADNVVVVTEGV